MDCPSKFARDDANDALVDGCKANLRLIDEQKAALRLHDEFGRRPRVLRPLGSIEQAQQLVELGLNFSIWCVRRGRVAGGDAGPDAVNRFYHTGAIKRLEKIVHGVHIEGTDSILVVGCSEDKLRQMRDGLVCAIRLARFGPLALHQPLDDGKTILARHLHIEKDEIGMVLLDQIHGFDTVGALRHNIHVTHRVKQILELVAGELFVVDYECRKRHEN